MSESLASTFWTAARNSGFTLYIVMTLPSIGLTTSTGM